MTRAPGPQAWIASEAWLGAFDWLDCLRRAQGMTFDWLGLGPKECRCRTIASGPLWRLSEYDGGGDGPPLLIVAAPIKRPYIWDLLPAVSAVRFCLGRGLRVFLLAWLPASSDSRDVGLEAFAAGALGEAVAQATRQAGGVRPFLIGHSLGGTFAAIHAALAGDTLAGLVLLGAPLSFAPGSSRFRDAVVSRLPDAVGTIDVVPGSLLTQLCAQASPDTFIWTRLVDAGMSLADPGAAAVHAGIERWALDELPLPGRLAREIFEQLYREDRFCRSMLEIDGRRLGPAAIEAPTLAVVNVADEIAPPASLAPVVEALPLTRSALLQHDRDVGVGFQHLAVLVGRQAHRHVWPRIADWIFAEAG